MYSEVKDISLQKLQRQNQEADHIPLCNNTSRSSQYDHHQLQLIRKSIFDSHSIRQNFFFKNRITHVKDEESVLYASSLEWRFWSLLLLNFAQSHDIFTLLIKYSNFIHVW